MTNSVKFDDAQIEAALTARAWPFIEAKRLINRFKKTGLPNTVIFETGYAPSGVPHIGTFGEVSRTTAVRNAFELLARNYWPAAEINTKLICFSDDMDGLRKVPDNVPNKEMLAKHLGVRLTAIPDPFGTHATFAEHNNERLKSFLDGFGFDYTFISATEYYRSGKLDAGLLRMLTRFDDIMAIMLPSLGSERQATYSPFMPVVSETNEVLQVPTLARDPEAGTIVYKDPKTGREVETPVTGGHVKCQWKPDWGLRWFCLDIDYEMAGKDLLESARLSSRICKVLGRQSPEFFNYELFLDNEGKRISKSKGNGLAVEEWLRYAPPESLALFMYQKPKTAKKLWFDVIPRSVDEYYGLLKNYHSETTAAKQIENPVWHIHSHRPPAVEMPLSFNLLLNLASVANASNKDILWGFIRRYLPQTSPSSPAYQEIDRLANYAVRYYHDFIKPNKSYRQPSASEIAALTELAAQLRDIDINQRRDGEIIQNIIYQIGKKYNFEPLRAWFKTLYEVLLGQSEGPRFGSFVALYGIDETCDLINKAIAQ